LLRWPDVEIVVRGDTGFATPEMYDCCEQLDLKYAFGYSTNAVLKRRTELKQRYAEALCELYDEKQQFFQVAGKEVATLRRQLFKTGAVVETSVRGIWIHFSGRWPRRSLFVRICEAVDRYLAGFLSEPTATGPPLTEYIAYYHNCRMHLSLERNSPVPREVEPPSRGDVIPISQVGALHHRYARAS
jgi:hypothetical protein